MSKRIWGSTRKVKLTRVSSIDYELYVPGFEKPTQFIYSPASRISDMFEVLSQVQELTYNEIGGVFVILGSEEVKRNLLARSFYMEYAN